MVETKKEKLFALIAAICSLVLSIRLFMANYSWIESVGINFYNIIWIIIFTGFTVLLFIRKKNVGFLVLSGIAFLTEFFYLIVRFDFDEVLSFFMYLSLFVLFMYNVVPILKNNNSDKKILCYIPAIMCLVVNAYDWFKFGFYFYLPEWLMICSFLFMGLWVREGMTNTMTRIAESSTLKYNEIYDDTFGGADKLKAYKDLLDSGVITQEEFETKKKQILGV